MMEVAKSLAKRADQLIMIFRAVLQFCPVNCELVGLRGPCIMSAKMKKSGQRSQRAWESVRRMRLTGS